MSVNPKVQEIVDKVAEKFAPYTTPESITPSVVTEAVAEAIQNLYACPDVFMTNNNVKEMDFTNYINVERIFAGQNPFISLDLSPVVLLKHLVTKLPTNGLLDLSSNTLLERLIIEDYSSAQSNIDLTANIALKELSIQGNDCLTTFPTIPNPSILEYLSFLSLNGITDVTLDLTAFTSLKKIVLSSLGAVTTIDLPNLTTLEHFEITLDNDNLTTFPSITQNPNLKYIVFAHNDTLTDADYQDILSDLIANGLENGYVQLTSNSGVTLSPTTEGYISTLEGLGWEVNCY